MKLKFLTLFFIFLTSSIFSQSFYARLYSGYGIGTSLTSASDYYANAIDHISYQKSNGYSLGKGLYFGSTFGYLVSQNIGIDVSLEYLYGLSNLHRDDYISSNYSNFRTYDNYGNALMIIPSLMIKTDFGFFKPYFKVGPIFSYSSITQKTDDATKNIVKDDNTGNTHEVTNKYYFEFFLNGQMAFGINFVIGASKEIWKNTEVFIELCSKNISYAPTKGEMLKHTINGEDRLSNIMVRDREINYYDFFDPIAMNGSNTDVPGNQSRRNYPFSSLIFSLGLSYNF